MISSKEQVKELRLIREDKEKAAALCRRIRDDESASDSDRLKAVELLYQLSSGEEVKQWAKM